MSVTSQALGATAKKNAPFLDRIAPAWALAAGDWIEEQTDASWRSVGMVMGALLMVLGGGMLLGGGYTSIQGVRLPLADMGVPVETTGLPNWWWWLLPGACTFIQIFAKIVPFLKIVWRPSMIYDGTTTAIYVALGLSTMLAASRVVGFETMVGVGLVSALLGLLNAVFAEKFFLGGIVMLRASFRR